MNANRNPFIYLKNMGSEMTSRGHRAASGLAAAALLVAASAAAHAQASPWATDERGAVRLVSAVSAVGTASTIWFGIELRLKPGWKTYWRVPGESGIPPLFAWSGSRNVTAVAVVWPRPRRFAVAGMQSYGYAGRVVFPVRVALARPSRPMSLHLDIRYAVCRDVCVPEQAHLVLDLGPGRAAITPAAADIATFAAAAPQPGAKLGWKVARAAIVARTHGGRRRFKLVVEVESTGTAFKAPDLVAEVSAGGPDGPRFGMAMARVGHDGRRVRFVLPYRHAGKTAPAASGLHLTVIDGAHCGTFEVEANPDR